MRIDIPFKELKYFSTYLEPFRKYYGLAISATLIQTLLGLIQPLFYRRLIDDVFNAPAPQTRIGIFFAIVSVLLGIRLLSILLTIFNSIYGTRVATSATNALESDVLKKLHLVPMHYHDRHAPGEIFPRLYGDPGMIVSFYLSSIPQLAASLIRVIIVCCVIIHYLWWAGLVSLIPVIPMWYISKYNIRYFKKMSDDQFKKQQALYMRVLDLLQGMKIVRVFKKSDFEMARFKSLQSDYQQLQIAAACRNAWMSPLIGTIGKLGGGIVFIAGAARLMQLAGLSSAGFSLGTLFMVLSYVWQLSGPITGFAGYSSQIGALRAASGRLKDLLEEKDEIPVSMVTDQTMTGSIVQFRNVSFSYDPEKKVLSDLTFSIRPGEKIGLVGPSGSGKTTLLNLICGFYSAESGNVMIKGNSSIGNERNTRDRPVLSLALQDGGLFQGSIRENLSYGREGLSEEDIVTALDIVEAREFTMALPKGLDTMVGDGARILSSGQMQRLTLARAVAADADLLIMDEATSWIDLWSEQRIFVNLMKVMRNRSILCISHRLHLMQLMDRILVLNNGRLVAQGTHDELLQTNRFYASSWSLRDFDGNVNES